LRSRGLAGGSFGDIGSVVESVKIMDQQGNVFEKERPVLSFSYKSVNILEGGIIVSARLKLHRSDQERMLRRIKEIWIYKKNDPLGRMPYWLYRDLGNVY